jgi:hypothetical protein
MESRYIKFSLADPYLSNLDRLRREGESHDLAAKRLLKACLELSPERDEVTELKERIAALETAIADLLSK